MKSYTNALQILFTSFWRIFSAKSTTGNLSSSFVIGGIFTFLCELNTIKKGVKTKPNIFKTKAAILRNTSIFVQFFFLLNYTAPISKNNFSFVYCNILIHMYLLDALFTRHISQLNYNVIFFFFCSTIHYVSLYLFIVYRYNFYY